MTPRPSGGSSSSAPGSAATRTATRSSKPETITAALGLHRELILKRHLASVLWLGGPHEPVGEDDPGLRRSYVASVEQDEELMPEVAERYGGVDPNEVYRRKLLFVAERLRRALDRAGRRRRLSRRARSSCEDLRVVRAQPGAKTAGERVAEGGLRDLIRQAEVFGFHLAKLDVRQESSTVVEAVAELIAAGTGRGPPGDGRGGSRRASAQASRDPRSRACRTGGRSRKSRGRCFETFERIRRAREEFSEPPVETFVLSMAHRASDVLCVQLLARRAGLLEVDEDGRCTANHLRISPLFETVDDLERAPEVLGTCWRTRSTAPRSRRATTCRRSCSATATRARTPATSRATGPCTRRKRLLSSVAGRVRRQVAAVPRPGRQRRPGRRPELPGDHGSATRHVAGRASGSPSRGR